MKSDAKYGTDVPVVKSGVPGLDDVLGGGFPEHRLYLIEGDPGSGKTTIGLQYLLEGAAHGERALYVTLSETRNELNAVAESHGWDIRKIDLVELIPSEDSLRADAQYKMFHPSEVELSETTKRVLEEVERIKPKRLVFDSLSEMRLLAQNPLRYRRQILALKQFFAGRDCTVLLLDDRTSSMNDLQLHSIAHGVITLEQLAPEYGAERRRMRITKVRGVKFRGGYHDFVITKGGVEIFPRLVAAEHGATFKQEMITSGVKAMDSLLGGGLDRGSSTLIMGPAGSGKSTVAAQYVMAAARRGEKAFMALFDESSRLLVRRCEGIGCDIQAEINNGRVTVRQIDPAELAPGEFTSMLRHAVEVDGARIVVIDSLNGYLNAMPEERHLTIQLHELLTYLGQQGVTTILVVAQAGIIGSMMKSPIDTSYLADSIILMRYFENGGSVRKAVSVVKKRGGQHEDTIREFSLSKKGITIGEPLRNFRGILTGVPVQDDRDSSSESKDE